MFQRVAFPGRRVALVALLVLASTSTVVAQPVVDPQRAEFAPSPDHNAVEIDGAPRLEFYQLDLYVAGQSNLIESVNLDKPDPEADGLIRVEFISLLSTPLVPGIIYEARVSSVGPGGSSASAVSNPFTLGTTCTPSISPTSQTAPAGSSIGTVTVTVDAGCAWTAVSNTSWITLTAGSSGNGPGVVGFSLTANTTASSRTGTLTVAGLTYTVAQAGVSCSYAVAPLSQSVSAAGQSGSAAVTAPTGCAWTATSNTGWIVVTSGASGSGNGTVSFGASVNPTTAARTGTLLIAGATLTVSQAAATCSYTLSPSSQVFGSASGTGTVAIATGSGCAWTASSDSSWVTIQGGGSGTGSGTIAFMFEANMSVSSRTATLTAVGSTLTITQAGTSCAYALTPATQTFGSSAGTATVVVTTTTGCIWKTTSNASWISVTANATGSGPGSTALAIAANTTAVLRTGTATIAGRTFTVTQAAAGCSLGVSPDSLSIEKAGGAGSLTVTVGTGCAWTATSPVTWLSLSGSGPGPATIAYTAAPNPSSFARTAIVAIGTRRIIVTQSGTGTPPDSPKNLRLIPKGGS